MSSPDRFSPRAGGKLPWAISGILLLLVAVIYGQTIFFGFINYDDNVFVYDCGPVRAGLNGSSIAWAFTNGPGGEWYPLSMLSHMLDCQIFGLDARGHHLTSVLLHAASAIGLFYVLWRMTEEPWPSAMAAALFAIHPQHVESVAWIAERRDVLSGLFFVLTLGAYWSYVRHGRSPDRYLVVAALFSLGLMSKAMLVTVPPLLLLLDFWPLGRFGSTVDLPPGAASVARQTFGKLVIEKLPLVAIAIGDCALTLATHAHDRASIPIAWTDRVSNAIVATAMYLSQFFWPVDLAIFYPVPAGGQPISKVVTAAMVLAVVSAATVVWRRRCPYLFVGWFWFLGMLVPVSGLVQVSARSTVDRFMADRYMYLPGIGLSLALAWGLARLGARSLVGRWAVGAAAALAVVALTGCATWQTSYWGNGEALWRHSIATTGSNSETDIGLAEALKDAGRLDEALLHYRRVAENSENPSLLNNFGTVLAQQDHLDEAETYLRRAVKLAPNSGQIRANLAKVLARHGQPAEASLYFLQAIEREPQLVEPRLDLARLYLSNGNVNEAMVQCRGALEIAPNNAEARQLFEKLGGAR